MVVVAFLMNDQTNLKGDDFSGSDASDGSRAHIS